MKVGVCEAEELKKRSEECSIPFADLLWGYAVEDLMLRISSSSYKDVLWLESFPILGEAAYRERSKKRIRFFYQESERTMPPEKLQPGQKLSEAMVEHMQEEIFGPENAQQIAWSGEITAEENGYRINFVAVYREMQVPLSLSIHSFCADSLRPGTREDTLTAIADKQISYLVFAPENQMCRDLLEIMEKLELIGDMGSYYRVYQILRSQPLSGRYVIDELTALTENMPKVKKEQRLEQIAGYRDYSYMRKRWEKYLRNHGQQPVVWAEALELVLEFLKPVWHSLCCNEIFFDDWMPELGRYLG